MQGDPTINWSPLDVQVTSLGFVKAPGLATVYTHPDWPALYFKRTDILERAMTCGGVAVVSPNRFTAYFGGTMVRAWHADKFGHVALPTKLSVAPRGDYVWRGTAPQMVGNAMMYPTGLHTICAHNVDPIGLGVFFKGDDGMLVNIVDTITSTGLPVTARMDGWANPTFEGYLDAITKPGTETDVNRNHRATMNGRAGFLSYSTWTQAQAYFKQAKPDFMALVPTDPPELTTDYSNAFDAAAAELTADKMVDVSIKVHFHPDMHQWTFENPHGIQDYFTGNTPNSANPLFVKDISHPAGVDLLIGCTYSMVLPLNSFYLDETGLMCPMPVVGVKMVTTSQGYPRYYNKPQTAAVLIDVTAVQQKQIKLTAKQTVDVSGIVPALLSGSKPYADRTGVIDAIPAAKSELDWYAKPYGDEWTPAGTAVNASIADGQNKANIASATALDMSNVAPVNVHVSTRFVERVAELVTQKIGPQPA